ncbi:MAG: lipoate--protein ligase family protein [Chlamydiota bacterium]
MFHILRLKSYPIYEQLLLEEALLRSDTRNFCLINQGSPPAIVMGISGKKEELVNCTTAAKDNIPLIKRFSGGGTVIVDENTLFVTFICQKQLHDFAPYPEPIMRWTESIYQKAFSPLSFELKQNDYVFGDKKCGGNAQYIKKDRWLHHTSFLWDYCPSKMSHLLHPKKTPDYRQGRQHSDFLTKLSEHFSSPDQVIEKILDEIRARYPTMECTLEEAVGNSVEKGRRTTTYVEIK